MSWHEMTLNATDPLFFRDARPMQGGGIGEGARWPLPQTLHGAVMSGLYRTWRKPRAWEAHRPEEVKQQKSGTDLRFGDLKSFGPLPVRDGQVYIPTPVDVAATEGLARTGFAPAKLPEAWQNNLPSPLRHAVARLTAPSKESVPPWMPLRSWIELQSAVDSTVEFPDPALFHSERSVGIERDDRTGATKEGQLYQAEKLRLADRVALKGWVSCATEPDYLKEWGKQPGSLMLGGESIAVRAEALRLVADSRPLDGVPDIAGTRVKWTLVSPALFRAGWRPAWVDEAGSVRLPAAPCPREPEESRKAWRERLKAIPHIGARLVATHLPSPPHVSGWQVGKNAGPKKTERLVAAGAVYYFEADNEEQANLLARALTMIPRSDSLGQKGYGYGICSTWTLHDFTYIR